MFRLMLAIGAIVALAVTIEVAVEANRSTGIRFEDITPRSGIDFVTDSSPTPNKNQPETMISGVGLIDYDNDGYPDIFLINGAAIPSLKKDSPKYYNRLFHNNHDGTFTDVTEKVGLAGDGYDMGVAIGDFDNDGWQDIYVASVTKNHLYRNNGDGTFSDVTDKAGVGTPTYKGRKMWSAAAGWLDYNNDGKLDLFVSNYCRWEVNKDPVCLSGGRLRAYCHPKFYEPLPSTLYRNNGDGTFTDVSDETGISKKLGKGMGVGFNDYDGDGFIDIFVANDNMANALFHNLKGKAFEEVAMDVGVAYSENGKAVSGMGAEFRDLDNDGLPDIWHTATELETFPLFRNRGKGIFNDGHMDIVVTVLNGKARILRNVTSNANNWIAFQLTGSKDNRMAIGAQLKVTTEDGASQYDIVSTSAGYGASRDPRPHFGLGPSKTVKQLLVRWPSGVRQVLKDLPADQIHRIVEP